MQEMTLSMLNEDMHDFVALIEGYYHLYVGIGFTLQQDEDETEDTNTNVNGRSLYIKIDIQIPMLMVGHLTCSVL